MYVPPTHLENTTRIHDIITLKVISIYLQGNVKIKRPAYNLHTCFERHEELQAETMKTPMF
jgi:hypothetical protein